jgi:diguanylate cyclase (GGDEF)-like protein
VRESALTSRGSVALLNSEGYWLYNGEDRSTEWAFMYDDRKDVSFPSEFPEEWQAIQNRRTGSVQTKNGYYAFSSILTSEGFSSGSEVPLVLDEGDWFIVSRIAPDSESGSYFSMNLLYNTVQVVRERYLIYLALLLVSVLVGALIAYSRAETVKIKYFSEYDTMTNVYNRRAGLEKLGVLYREAKKERKKLCICFIDINGLKEVNDNLGHEAGDALLLRVVDGIKACVRNTDLVIRLGGDEFLILFQDADLNEGEKIWSRITEEYRTVNETQNRKYVVSASHGIQELDMQESDPVDAAIQSADDKMYREKREIKKDLRVMRR